MNFGVSSLRLWSMLKVQLWKQSARRPSPAGRPYSTATNFSEKSVKLNGFDPKLHWSDDETDYTNWKDEAVSAESDNEKERDRHSTGDLEDSSWTDSQGSSSRPHIPVLCREVMDCFWRLDNLADEAPTFLDMTFGAGGHSSALLETFPDCKLYVLDRDPVALEHASVLQEKYADRVVPLRGKFSELPSVLLKCGMKKPFDGILLDAGCSSMQMDQGDRGFAFSKPDSPLDMRMDGKTDDSQLTAADIVNRMNEENLGNLFKKYGDEKHSKRIARAIVENRFMKKKITTTGDLADIVGEVCGFGDRTDRLNRKQHPATKVFQALRIFINDELNELDYAMSIGHSLLRPRGIFVAITFHSMECKIVKDHFHSADWRDRLMHNPLNPQVAQLYRNYARFLPKEDVLDAMQFRWMLLNKKAIQPSQGEMQFNPRSRSAKLRAALKIVV